MSVAQQPGERRLADVKPRRRFGASVEHQGESWYVIDRAPAVLHDEEGCPIGGSRVVEAVWLLAAQGGYRTVRASARDCRLVSVHEVYGGQGS